MQTATYKGSIQKKFTRAIFVLISIVTLSGYLLFVSWYIYNQNQKSIILAKDVTQILSQDFLKLMLLDDLNTASDLTTKLQAFPQIDHVILYDKKNKRIFQYKKEEQIQKSQLFQTTTQLNYNKTNYGKLLFEFKVESLYEILRSDLPILLLVLFIFLSFSLLLARSYATYFSRPLLYLVNFLEQIDFQKDCKHYYINGKYDDEIGKLYEEINIMFSKIFDFITQRDKAQEQLKFMMQYDALTGLLNKNGFLETLKNILKEENSYWSAMFYVKITNLRTINHVYDYKFGDYLLRETAKKIRKNFKDSTLSATLSPGDFVLYYQYISTSKKTTLLEAQHIADSLVAILSHTLHIENKILKPEVYVGVDIFYDEQNPLEILKHTNIALDIAKSKNQRIVYFDKENEIELQEVFNVFEDLQVALEKEQFELYYQLQYNSKREIFGAEALIRWNHPKYGLLAPSKFIPIAERTDFIIDIGEWVLNAACKQLKLWQNNKKTKEWTLSVNISAKQFYRDNFVQIVKEISKTHNINTTHLKLELLESLFIEKPHEVAQKMQELKKLGFQLSLDDFGTGYSSLQYLKIFPLNQIKIDQSFVLNMFANEKDVQIIKSIIYLGELLGIDVIAEGVEEYAHYEELRTLGCHAFQGYYFAKPQNIKDISALLL
jgi:diguanylate cyclase (GGDEF)-like protein